jgi:putative membrane protein
VLWLLVCHAFVLCYGGHYTYAETPLDNWVEDLLGTQHNNYDRFAHFVPAILVRELLLRLTPLRGWTFTLTAATLPVDRGVLRVRGVGGGRRAWCRADDFLGTQGDVWDTQWDMFLCLCGALVAQVLLRRVHDRQLAGGRQAGPDASQKHDRSSAPPGK